MAKKKQVIVDEIENDGDGYIDSFDKVDDDATTNFNDERKRMTTKTTIIPQLHTKPLQQKPMEMKKKYKPTEKIILASMRHIISAIESGCSDKDIYTALGIGKSSWYVLKEKMPELKNAVEQSETAARESNIRDKINKLHQLADGYTMERVTTVRVIKSDGEAVETITTESIPVPPNPLALTFLIKNLTKGDWSDNPAKAKLEREKLEFDKIQQSAVSGIGVEGGWQQIQEKREKENAIGRIKRSVSLINRNKTGEEDGDE